MGFYGRNWSAASNVAGNIIDHTPSSRLKLLNLACCYAMHSFAGTSMHGDRVRKLRDSGHVQQAADTRGGCFSFSYHRQSVVQPRASSSPPLPASVFKKRVLLISLQRHLSPAPPPLFFFLPLPLFYCWTDSSIILNIAPTYS